MFRYAVLGAATIAHKFCHAVSLIENCTVCAVASKSLEKAKSFAEKNKIEHFYDDYENLLVQEKPDCVYIAVTTNDHYRLTMLSLKHRIPVLCEKAMFCTAAEAEEAFALAREKNVFLMEAMWSRFLPPIKKAKEWLTEERVGTPIFSQCSIGFKPYFNEEDRLFSLALGGGVSYDLTVYNYMLTSFLLEQEERERFIHTVWAKTGVDVVNHISIQYEHTLADLTSSIVAKLDEKLEIHCTDGKIVIPSPHFAWECYLYNSKGECIEQFADTETRNGFIYEAKEAMRCIQAGLLESPIVPWKDTLSAAKLYDEIWKR